MQGPSAGLLEFASDYSYPPYAVSVRMSRDRFLALLMKFLLNNNDARAARGQPNQARKICHWKFSMKN
jgi:hypothetical protein